MTERHRILADGRIVRAFHYMRRAHNSVGQVRKYTREPYWKHPLRVFSILIAAGEDDSDILIAALLHDVVEDVYRHPLNLHPDYSLVEIESIFGSRVRWLVDELTDEFTKDRHPEFNRHFRKFHEAVRIGRISASAMRVKLADMIHNTISITTYDKDFAVKYLREKAFALSKMSHLISFRPNDTPLQRLFTYADWQVRFGHHPAFAI